MPKTKSERRLRRLCDQIASNAGQATCVVRVEGDKPYYLIRYVVTALRRKNAAIMYRSDRGYCHWDEDQS